MSVSNKDGNKKKVVIAITLFLAFITILAAVGILTAIIKNRTGALASTGGISYTGQQFQQVKQVTAYVTQYSPNMPSIGNTCDSDTGGNSSTADGHGQFKVKDGTLQWVWQDGSKSEEHIFAQPSDDPFFPWSQRNDLAIVVPGFKDNLPIHVRDHYAPGNHKGEYFLDLFVPCGQMEAVANQLAALKIPGVASKEGGIPILVSVVDLTKPLGNSSFGPNVNGTYYPPLGGQKATSSNSSSHDLGGSTGHAVFLTQPFGDDFKNVADGAVDFNSPGGTPVYATFDGTVVGSIQMYQPKSGAYKFGAGILWIKSSDGNNGATYAHIAFASGITNGSTIKKGQQIGTVAPTCGSGQCVTFKSGSHLHFQIYINKTGQNKNQIMQLFPNAV